ncbi:hypothetical protein ARTHRO9AX_220280 [Arthrobacter sp. 9AX]|nr:hypothetical protein ARTHRO9AX_220280 [Arthrobacter sp. 9AX]
MEAIEPITVGINDTSPSNAALPSAASRARRSKVRSSAVRVPGGEAERRTSRRRLML